MEKKVITELTDEHRAKFPHYVEKWLKVGLCTDPANRPEAEDGLKKAYEIAKLDPPELVVWADGPISGMRLQSIISKNDDAKKLLNETPVSEREGVIKQLLEKHKNDEVDVYWSCYGQQEASWLSFYDFFNIEFGIDTSILAGLKKVAENSGWFWVFDDFAVMSERPEQIHIEDEVLHNLNGPSISYKNDLKIFSYKGVNVPEWIIMESYKITPDVIKKESNAELRRVMISIYGLDKWVINGGFKPIHKDDRGELYEDDEGRKVVKVICSTKGESYFIPVPPHVGSASEAVAGTFQLGEKEYSPDIET